MQVCERCLQQLGEAGGSQMCCVRIVFLEVRGLLMLQLQLSQLQYQRLLPHCSLGRRSSVGGWPQVGYGEAKDKDGVGGEEGEGGAHFHTLALRGGKYLRLIYFGWQEKILRTDQHSNRQQHHCIKNHSFLVSAVSEIA